MLNDIKAVYATAWRAAFVFPLLFLIPVTVEFAQHVVELRIGMYDGLAAAKAVAEDAGRMAGGYAKTLALLLPGYWFVRYMALGNKARAARPEWPAFGLWLMLFAFQAALLANSLFGPPLAQLLGLTGRAAKVSGPLLTAAWALFGVYWTAWYVAWPLGNRAIGPLRSLSVMAGSFWRTLGYMAACILPLMVVHYALGYLAIAATPAWLDWPVLVIDALLVGLLACTMAGASFVAARSAAVRKGVDLAG